MASLSKKDILHLSHLAKIPLMDEEVELFAIQLSNVVDYFNSLSSVDTSNIEPTHQTTGLTDVLRADKVNNFETLSAVSALSQAKNVYNDFFVVPQLIDQE